MKTRHKNKNENVNNAVREELLDRARRYGIRYIDLKLDFAFKCVFGTEGHEDILLMLIDSILPDKHIVSVKLGSQEEQGDRPDSRRSIYDIHCTTESGTHVTVEMQCNAKSDFNNRMVYYSGYTLRNSITRGDEGFDFPEIYVIGILDFLLPGVRENSEVVNHYSLRNDRDDGITLTDALHYVTIELPKFRKKLSELESTLDRLLYLFRYLGTMEEIPNELIGKNLEGIFELTKFANMTQELQDRYFREFMYEMDQKSALRTARNSGIAEGEAIGEARVIKAMKAKGLDTALISEITGLGIEQIEKL